MHLLPLQRVELLERRHRGSRMRPDRQASALVREGRRANHPPLDVAERAAVESQLDESRADARVLDAPGPLLHPSIGECLDGIGAHVRRQMDELTRRICARRRQHVQATRLGQAPEHHWVTPQSHGRRIHEGPAPECPYPLQARKHDAHDLVGIVGDRLSSPLGVRLKAREHVLVRQRHAHVAGVDPTLHGHDPPRGNGPARCTRAGAPERAPGQPGGRRAGHDTGDELTPAHAISSDDGSSTPSAVGPLHVARQVGIGVGHQRHSEAARGQRRCREWRDPCREWSRSGAPAPCGAMYGRRTLGT